MIILYISALPKTKAGGPRYSVPEQIAAQAKFDDVYWINFNEYGVKDTKIECNNVKEPFKFRLDNLYYPFNNPDLVVFEGLYYLEFYWVAYELRRKDIPYIIIPRGSLTVHAQKIKKIKKKVGNLLVFNRFIKNADAIQFLTDSEYSSSGDKWNKKHIIIPNGVETKKHIKIWEKTESIRGVFIGRMNMYHKGLDYLMEACIKLKSELIKHKCTIELYGPDRNGAKQILLNKIETNNLRNIIFIKDEIYNSEKEKTLLQSDFFILTSRFEGHPMGLIEALSYGLPCLVTEGTNMGKEISESNAGWVAENSIESISEKLRNLINEKDSLEFKGHNALQLSKEYNWDKIAEISHNQYMNLINDKY